MIYNPDSAKIIRETAYKQCIDAICHRCANGEEREIWGNDRTHSTTDLSHIGFALKGHFSCPANPIYRMIEEQNKS